jgi:glycosyltransferase involved in cell wall biosynthesis
MTSGAVFVTSGPSGYLRGILPARWLRKNSAVDVRLVFNAAPVLYQGPTFGIPAANMVVDNLIAGPPRTWHVYPVWGNGQLVRHLSAGGHRVLVGLDDDYWNPPPWYPRGYARWDTDELERILACADGVVVTTLSLAARAAKCNANVVEIPNALDLGSMPPVSGVRTGRARRLGWAGSACHQGDTALLEGPVRALLERDAAVTFVVAGEVPTWVRPVRSRVELGTRYLGVLEHYARLAALELDVFLVPLSAHPYSLARSVLEAMEAAALGIPMIVSDVGP